MLSVKVQGKVKSDLKEAISFEAIFEIVLSTKFVVEGRNCKHLFRFEFSVQLLFRFAIGALRWHYKFPLYF